MSPKLPVATAKDVTRVAQRLGFEFRRQSGSHAIYVRKSDQARVVVPMQSWKVAEAKNARGIIHALKITVEEFANLLSVFLERTAYHLPNLPSASVAPGGIYPDDLYRDARQLL